jgi:NAD(P)-dependent dehydrogenase (short-subunit alcohol dehydrogenase family)
MSVSSTQRKVALVTGATRGIGKACALALARAGFDVVATGRTLAEGEGKSDDPNNPIALPGSVARTVQEIEAEGGRALGLKLDILDRASIDAAIDRTLAEWGRIDVLLNNALYGGPGNQKPLRAFTMEDAENAFAGNALNQIYITRRVLEPMLKQGAGRIIFMSSASSVTTPKMKPPKGGFGLLYSASKAAMNRISDFVHLEHYEDGIRAFLIHPAFTYTDTMDAKNKGQMPAYGAAFDVHTPEVTADVVVWMATNPNSDKYAGAKMISAPYFFAKEGIDPKAV